MPALAVESHPAAGSGGGCCATAVALPAGCACLVAGSAAAGAGCLAPAEETAAAATDRDACDAAAPAGAAARFAGASVPAEPGGGPDFLAATVAELVAGFSAGTEISAAARPAVARACRGCVLREATLPTYTAEVLAAGSVCVPDAAAGWCWVLGTPAVALPAAAEDAAVVAADLEPGAAAERGPAGVGLAAAPLLLAAGACKKGRGQLT